MADPRPVWVEPADESLRLTDLPLRNFPGHPPRIQYLGAGIDQPINQTVNVVPIINVNIRLRNWNQYGIEDDFGRFIQATFNTARNAAYGYFGFPLTTPGHVRVTMAHVYIASEDDHVNMGSDMAHIYQNDEHTMAYLYTVILKKYTSDTAGARTAGGGSGFNYRLRTDIQYDFTMEYQFALATDGIHRPIASIEARSIYAGNFLSGYFDQGEGGRANAERRRSNIDLGNVIAGGRTRASRVAGRLAPAQAAAVVLRPAANTRSQARRESGAATGVGVGVEDNRYTRLKNQIYIRRSLEDIFTYSKAVKGTPETEDRMCFPMAFMMCQMRRIHHTTFETGEISAEVSGIFEGERLEVRLDPEADIPGFVVENTFYDPEERIIRLFDCSKTRLRGTPLYENEIETFSDEKIKNWLWCAFQVHAYVSYACGSEVDVNNLESCLSAYSYAFGVNISVFAIEEKGDRIASQRVISNSKQEDERFVNMLLQGSHLHAISSIRDYHKSEINASRSCLHSYCDYCTQGSLHWKKDYKHQTVCSKEGNWGGVKSLESLHARDMVETKKFKTLKKDEEFKMMCGVCKTHEPLCNCPGGASNLRNVLFITCTSCRKDVPRNHYNVHDCYMRPKKIKEKIDNSKLFVYDLESIQEYDEAINQYVHECHLVCLRAIYDDRKWHFLNIRDFVRFLIDNEEMHGSTILAHNGGGYDHQFILSYLEDNSIPCSTIPRPNTLHKYLKLTMAMKGDKTAINFLDFMMMMTDSLKNIGAAFKLPVCKGDFPHNFSKQVHLDYEGPLPSRDSEADYYGFKNVKSAKELEESRAYWKSQEDVYCTCIANVVCNCTKRKWNFREQWLAYCWLDVDVLAGACKAYRDQMLEFSGETTFGWQMSPQVDPYTCMTQSQIALTLFTAGKEQNDIAITHEKMRDSFQPDQIKWMEYEMSINPRFRIQHAGNFHKEWYDVDSASHVCGYCSATQTVFEYRDCYYDGCPTCYPEKANSMEEHPVRKVAWKTINAYNDKKWRKLVTNNIYKAVKVQWSHDNHKIDESGFEWDPEMGKLMRLRGIFYGGRTEVFSSYCNPAMVGMEIKYDDVSSLYPYVCSYRDLPVGIPTTYFYKDVDISRLKHDNPDRYFGFVRCKVRPRTDDLIGILPERLEEKLQYTLHEKSGCWSTEFIYLAQEHGYEVLDVYEVWHWPKDQRSDTCMRGYMGFFLRMKQEAEGWSKLGQDVYGKDMFDSAVPTPEQQETIADYIEKCNGGFARPRVAEVQKNPVKRQLAKIFLNCLWGKLSQKNPTELETSIHGYRQYLELMGNPRIDKQTLKFRHVHGSVYKSRYALRNTIEESNPYVNVPMAASVTAHAQIILMKQMFVVGPERVLYCDTDSIIYLREEGDPKYTKSGLGNWADEHPNQKIVKFLALAPKCYVMSLEDEDVFKCKGVRSTEENRKLTSAVELQKLVQGSFFVGTGIEKITANTMTIHPNSTNAKVPYGTLLTRYGTKDIQTVFSKRNLIVNADPERTSLDQMGLVRLVPFGYTGSVTHV